MVLLRASTSRTPQPVERALHPMSKLGCVLADRKRTVWNNFLGHRREKSVDPFRQGFLCRVLRVLVIVPGNDALFSSKGQFLEWTVGRMRGSADGAAPFNRREACFGRRAEVGLSISPPSLPDWCPVFAAGRIADRENFP